LISIVLLISPCHSQKKDKLLKEMSDGLDKFTSTAVENIASTVLNKLEEDPWFMKVLSDVAKVHPFVSGDVILCPSCCTLAQILPTVVVIAFQVCYKMETARRQNDKRVIALLQEMRKMMEVLTQ
jgi:hypothetical protein